MSFNNSLCQTESCWPIHLNSDTGTRIQRYTNTHCIYSIHTQTQTSVRLAQFTKTQTQTWRSLGPSLHPTGFNCRSIYPSFGIQVQYYVGLSAQKCTNCYHTPDHVHYQQLHNQSFFKSFKFSALPPPSTSPPAPWSSYELATSPPH